MQQERYQEGRNTQVHTRTFRRPKGGRCSVKNQSPSEHLDSFVICGHCQSRRAPSWVARKGGYPMREPEYKYTIEIFWSDEDGCFIACVPDLENCAAWGVTYEETLAQAHVATRADLTARRRFGEPIPEPTPRFLPAQSIN